LGLGLRAGGSFRFREICLPAAAGILLKLRLDKIPAAAGKVACGNLSPGPKTEIRPPYFFEIGGFFERRYGHFCRSLEFSGCFTCWNDLVLDLPVTWLPRPTVNDLCVITFEPD